MNATSKATNRSFAYRLEGKGYRIYCVPKQDLRKTMKPAQHTVNGSAIPARW